MKKLLIGFSALATLFFSGCASIMYDLEDSINWSHASKKLLKEGCDSNRGKACNRLGNLYRPDYKGDWSKTKMYYRKSCDLNSAAGCFNLGSLYRYGDGVKKDYSKAVKYYDKACDLKSGLACAELTIFYKYGKGVKKDYSKAKEYYEKTRSSKIRL